MKNNTPAMCAWEFTWVIRDKFWQKMHIYVHRVGRDRTNEPMNCKSPQSKKKCIPVECSGVAGLFSQMDCQLLNKSLPRHNSRLQMRKDVPTQFCLHARLISMAVSCHKLLFMAAVAASLKKTHQNILFWFYIFWILMTVMQQWLKWR